jgi:hypothetical protein
MNKTYHLVVVIFAKCFLGFYASSVPDDPEDILDEEDLPVLDRWAERAAYDLWTLGDEVETSTPTMIEFALWHEQPLDCGPDQNSTQYYGYADGSRRTAAGFGWTLRKSDRNGKKRRLPGIRVV